MFDEDKLKGVVGAMLGIDATTVGPETSTDTVNQWDSIRHMNLVIALERAYDISIPDDEVASMTSYPIIKATIEEQLARA